METQPVAENLYGLRRIEADVTRAVDQSPYNTVNVMSSGVYSRTLPYLTTFMGGNSSGGHHHKTASSVCFLPYGMMT
jgi:hypothetical protein